MNDKHFVLTIERQYGSGGPSDRQTPAEELSIHFAMKRYSKMTSETSQWGTVFQAG